MANKSKRKHRRLKPHSPEVGGEGRGYPFVAIVGRPNVGKSTLFNRLVGQRLAITEPTAGTTRDRIAAIVSLEDGRAFELCDTGGLGGTGDSFDADVNAQIDVAVEYADIILFMVDSRAGLIPLDEQIARRLKKLKKPVIVVANKAETAALEAQAGEFYALGFDGDVFCISAKEGLGRSDLLAVIAGHLPEEAGQVEGTGGPVDPAQRVLRIAILGRRNVGKSTYVNHLFGSERVIVSATAGTTRDAVDVRVTVSGREVILIDTAGLRKRGKADDQIEIISHGRAEMALRRSDVVLLFLDCVTDVSQVDKKLSGMIASEHKACVIVANKWDLVRDQMDLEQFADYLAQELPGLSYCPLVSISAKDGDRGTAPVEMAFELYRQSMERVGTGVLNRALTAALTLRRPKPLKNRVGKVFFGTQVATNPATVLLFVNDPQLFPQSYRRYLAGQLRQHLPWGEVPIKLVFRARESLYKKGGGLARRVRGLEGLAEQARWVEDQPVANVSAIEGTLDAAEVQEALLDAFAAPDEGEEEPLE